MANVPSMPAADSRDPIQKYGNYQGYRRQAFGTKFDRTMYQMGTGGGDQDRIADPERAYKSLVGEAGYSAVTSGFKGTESQQERHSAFQEYYATQGDSIKTSGFGVDAEDKIYKDWFSEYDSLKAKADAKNSAAALAAEKQKRGDDRMYRVRQRLARTGERGQVAGTTRASRTGGGSGNQAAASQAAQQGAGQTAPVGAFARLAAAQTLGGKKKGAFVQLAERIRAGA